ncbi:MAG: hypothetical protein KJ838_00010 [Candidatus Omnitrophica bacterium]|nr:hypothetical protein [Candidatus Omnitrophota bacterium]
MFNLADMAKLTNQASKMQRQQEQKQEEQINLLKHISVTLEEILAELRNKKQLSEG